MGYAEAFDYASSADIFREHAALSGFENDGSRDFDIGGLSKISDANFDLLPPVLWPQGAKQKAPRQRFFENGGFFTPNKRGRFISPEAPRLSDVVTDEFPLRLNTGRIRDQWHTMTRTGLSPRLAQHLPEPFIEVHPLDAEKYRLKNSGFARIKSVHGEALFRVKLEDGQQQGSVFVPIHWSLATSSAASVGNIVMPATDPFSGQPEAKATPVFVEPVELPVSGFVISMGRIEMPRNLWWSRVALEKGEGLLFAGTQNASHWKEFFAPALKDSEVVEYEDKTSGAYRAASIRNGKLEFCLFAGPSENLVLWDAVKATFAKPEFSVKDRAALLSGKNSDGIADAGPVICSCFGVGLKSIREAIETGKACSIDAIGVQLRAGTNCGSCKPELKRILADARATETV